MKYRDIVRWAGQYRWFAWSAAKAAPLDAKILRRTRGRYGLLGHYGLPQCLVTTIGRKSGQPRTVTLLYGTDADDIILVGSNFGQSHHPAWALNLEATPQAQVSRDGETVELTAHQVTDPADREHLWQVMYELWPAYAAYRGRAGREIKMFRLREDPSA